MSAWLGLLMKYFRVVFEEYVIMDTNSHTSKDTHPQ